MQGMASGEMALVGAALFTWLLFMMAMLALIIIIWWQIFKKAGYSPGLGILMVVPLVNVIMLFVLAFGKWPIYEKLSKTPIKQE